MKGFSRVFAITRGYFDIILHQHTLATIANQTRLMFKVKMFFFRVY